MSCVSFVMLWSFDLWIISVIVIFILILSCFFFFFSSLLIELFFNFFLILPFFLPSLYSLLFIFDFLTLSLPKLASFVDLWISFLVFFISSFIFVVFIFTNLFTSRHAVIIMLSSKIINIESFFVTSSILKRRLTSVCYS